MKRYALVAIAAGLILALSLSFATSFAQDAQGTPGPQEQEPGTPTPEADQGDTGIPQGEGQLLGGSSSQQATPAPEEADMQAAPEELQAEGGEIYATICAACHRPEGEGVPDSPFPPLNNNPFVTQDDPAPVVEVVLFGRAGMPAFGDDFSLREIAGIVTYIRTAWDNEASPVTIEEVQTLQQNVDQERSERVRQRSGEGDQEVEEEE